MALEPTRNDATQEGGIRMACFRRNYLLGRISPMRLICAPTLRSFSSMFS